MLSRYSPVDFCWKQLFRCCWMRAARVYQNIQVVGCKTRTISRNTPWSGGERKGGWRFSEGSSVGSPFGGCHGLTTRNSEFSLLADASVRNRRWTLPFRPRERQGTVVSITTSLLYSTCRAWIHREGGKNKLEREKNTASRQQDAHGPEKDGWLDAGNGERRRGRRDFWITAVFG